ncbi:precorrin-3B synthase [Allosaccharopolyspora coralli]|uniref:Precorrin-3B synthase n=1 Tax=Allosaccharopolyspora coralli TaxID=2665642 RepID=A0A5Q3QEI6_9PSEU|nr:precorrin-3B synthase [Allosaccharopolyspora coralli]
MNKPGPPRTREDACPGAWHVHAAADGGLARIRLPGGRITAGQMRFLAESASELGNGQLELTSRANLQLRGVDDSDVAELATRLGSHGLLPSRSHETCRNVIASPCTGLDDDGLLDVSRCVEELDTALCAVPELAALPGRFLFTVDDGRGDVSTLGGDIGLHAVGATEFAVLLAGRDSGVRVGQESAARSAITAAEAFMRQRAAEPAPVWRLAELYDGRRRIAADLGRPCSEPSDPPFTEPVRPGIAARRGNLVALAVGAPLGRLTPQRASQLAALADRAGGDLRITPWRSVLVPGLAAAEAATRAQHLREQGFVVEADSPWSGMTACTGTPGCAKSHADVQRDAHRVAESLEPGGTPVHWVGCSRRCGTPRATAVEVLATGAGYDVRLADEVTASGLDAEDTPAAINAARRTA